MPIQMTDEMKTLVNKALADRVPCMLSTASKSGEPSLGLRGSMMVYDDGHLAWWERAKRDGLHHIQENPRVVVMYRNPDPNVRRTWKFYGKARVVESGPQREEVMKRTPELELNQDPERKGVAVIVEVDLITLGNGQVVMARDEAKHPVGSTF
jgi:predicted pyridoxine 5'-phosphate oxidase superfamily flavin-nucleotide-binding protein